MQDPYRTLGVDRSASESDVRRAYRKLAMEHHPDKGGDPEKFKDITRAYDQIKKGDALIILEAMKMENILSSPVDGVIKEIKVKPQQTVEKNNVLINFES